jgi:hypothetical protein
MKKKVSLDKDSKKLLFIVNPAGTVQGSGEEQHQRLLQLPWRRTAARGVLNSWLTPPMNSRWRSFCSVRSAILFSTASAIRLKLCPRSPTSSRPEMVTRLS